MMHAERGGVRTAKVLGILLATALMAAAWLAPQARAADAAHAVSSVQAGVDTQSTNGAAVLEAFDQQQVQRVKQASELNDRNKRLIMFTLAVPLFILLLVTGGLGIATGVYGKKLFIPHMVCAGLTVTLALAHAIVGIVWFYPF